LPDQFIGQWLIQLAKTEVLVLDDWGLAGIDAQTRADLLEIIDYRLASKVTIITSQLPIEHWYAWVGDGHHCRFHSGPDHAKESSFHPHGRFSAPETKDKQRGAETRPIVTDTSTI